MIWSILGAVLFIVTMILIGDLFRKDCYGEKYLNLILDRR